MRRASKAEKAAGKKKLLVYVFWERTKERRKKKLACSGPCIGIEFRRTLQFLRHAAHGQWTIRALLACPMALEGSHSQFQDFAEVDLHSTCNELTFLTALVQVFSTPPYFGPTDLSIGAS
jgi:hypothetical protein